MPADKTTKINRLYNFVNGTASDADKVDAELDQLITQENNVVDDIADLQSQITTDTSALATHKTSGDHDGRYFTETELGATTDGTSGADKIGATAITNLSGTTVQALLESLRNILKSTTDSSSGADFVAATGIGGLTGTTIQAILESLKTYIDTHKTSSDHDGRYYTESELGSTTDNASGSDRIGITQVDDVAGNTVQEFAETLRNILKSTTDNASGADFVAATPIANVSGSTIQAILESLVTILKSNTLNSSGADFVNASTISGITGSTVQALLNSLKTYIDTHKTSPDHDGRYYTETEIADNATTTSSGAKKVGVKSTYGSTVQDWVSYIDTNGVSVGGATIPADGSVTPAKLDTTLYNEIYSPTSLATTTATQEITSLPSTALKSRLDVTLQGNTGMLDDYIDDTYWLQVASQLGSETNIYSLTTLNGEIFGGTGPNGKLLKWNGLNAWIEVAPKLGSEIYILSLITLNGEIYGGTVSNGKLYKWNGSNAWIEVAPKLGSETYIFSLIVLNGEIYGGTLPNGKLYKWNGTNAWIEVAPKLGSETAILSLTTLNGEIYGGTTPNGKLYKWNGTNAWIEVAPKLSAETHIYSLTTLNNEIYGATYPNGKLYKWNGSNAWVEVAPKLGSETDIRSLVTIGNEIYGGTAPNGKLYKWNGLNAWIEVASQLGSETVIRSLTTLNGEIYGGTELNGNLYRYLFSNIESTGKQIVKSVGKNLIRNGNAEEGLLYGRATLYNNVASPTKVTTNGNGFEITSTAQGDGFESWFIPIEKNKSYTFQAKFTTISGSPNFRILILCYDSNNNILNTDGLLSGSGLFFTSTYQGYISGTQTVDGVFSRNFQITNDAVKYIKCKALNYTYTIIVKSLIQNMQLEQSTTATTYEEYTETTAIIPAELKQVSDSIRDTFNANLGVYTKNVSDWVELYGNNYTWNPLGAFDYTGYKIIGTLQTNFLGIISSSDKIFMVKYNSKKLTSINYSTNTPSSEDVVGMGSSYLNISVSDTDTGWDETWVSGTSFTGMTWANLIKAYMNGWKLTTANTNVASCVWTGISSGTTQSGASGYTHVTTTIDTGYTPYRMIYQLKTPIVTNYYPNVINAEPSGTVYVYPFVADYDFYDNGCGVSDITYPINSLEYVNIVDKDAGALSPIDLSTCTVASGGLSFTSTALSASDLVDFGYTYKELSTIPTIEYSYPTNLKATVDGNTNDLRDLDKKVNQLARQENSRIYTTTVTLGEISATSTFGAFIAPTACDIVDVKIVTKDAIAASDTNYWQVDVIDKGSAGADTNTIATKTTKTTGGQAFASYDAWDVGTLDTTHSKLEAGDVVLLTFTKTGTPTAFAEAFAVVSYVIGD